MSLIYTQCRAILCSLALATPVVALAQTEVQRYNATAENGYGVVYTLPKTEIEVSALVVETTTTPGVLHPWASKYLGTMPLQQEGKRYHLAGVALRVVGVPDSEKQYLVAFDRKTVAPFVRLAPGNLIYSINGDADPAPEAPALTIPSPVVPDRAMPALPREYSLATTEAKRAEIAATYIYDLREHAMGVVTGDAENMPKDGDAMRLALEHLRREEQRTLRLFLGDTTQTARIHRWRVVPETEDVDGRILFRFSTEWGVVEADDLSGDAVYLSSHIVERAPALDEKEQRRRDAKPEGIVYNMPGTADVRINLGDRELAKARLPITQVGTTQTLAKRMLNIKEGATTAVYFDLNTGALLRVTSE